MASGWIEPHRSGFNAIVRLPNGRRQSKKFKTKREANGAFRAVGVTGQVLKKAGIGHSVSVTERRALLGVHPDS